MVNACPVLSSEERKAAEILYRAQQTMMEKVYAAVAEAAGQVRDQVLAAGLDVASAPEEYCEAVVHQRMDLTLCGAIVDTFEGGDAGKAIELFRNPQMIAHRDWAADIAVTPKAQ